MGITACFDGDLCKSSRPLRHYSRLTRGWEGGGVFHRHCPRPFGAGTGQRCGCGSLRREGKYDYDHEVLMSQ